MHAGLSKLLLLMVPEGVLFGEWWVMGMVRSKKKKKGSCEMLSPDEELAPRLALQMLLLLWCLVQLVVVNKAEQNIPH